MRRIVLVAETPRSVHGPLVQPTLSCFALSRTQSVVIIPDPDCSGFLKCPCPSLRACLLSAMAFAGPEVLRDDPRPNGKVIPLVVRLS